MRIFCIQPGASVSTSDVYNGLVSGLKELGHEIINYQLDVRIGRATEWLNFNYEKAKEKSPDTPMPTAADILFQACATSIAVAMWKKPDWVLIVSSMYYPKLFVKMLKQAGLKVALLFTESPYDDEQQYPLAAVVDVCWTNERSSVEKLKVCNPNTHYLPHAYDDKRHGTSGIDNDLPAHDVVFVGTGFQERVELFEGVNWDGIDFGLYGPWELINQRSPLHKHLRNEFIANDTAAELYRKAKIGLNLYRTSKGFGTHVDRVATAESMNPRAYELAACGCFHVSDYRAELEETFGDAVPTFTNAAELERHIRYWLEHEEERKSVAARLPQLVNGSTWLNRVKQMMGDLGNSPLHKEGYIGRQISW